MYIYIFICTHIHIQIHICMHMYIFRCVRRLLCNKPERLLAPALIDKDRVTCERPECISPRAARNAVGTEHRGRVSRSISYGSFHKYRSFLTQRRAVGTENCRRVTRSFAYGPFFFFTNTCLFPRSGALLTRLVGSLKLQVSFAKEPNKRDEGLAHV